MNSFTCEKDQKLTTNSQLSTTESKTKPKNLSKLEQEENPRNGDHMEGYQWGGGGERMGEKVQGIRSIIGRYIIDGEVKNSIGMEKPKN